MGRTFMLIVCFIGVLFSAFGLINSSATGDFLGMFISIVLLLLNGNNFMNIYQRGA